MKFCIKKMFVAVMAVFAITVAANTVVYADTDREVFYSVDVSLANDIVLRVEVLTPREILGVITVVEDWGTTTTTTPFSVALIDDDEPYLLIRYYIANRPDGVYMPTREYALMRDWITGGTVFSAGDGAIGWESDFVTANNPLYIRFGYVWRWVWPPPLEETPPYPPTWYGISRIGGSIFDADIDSWMEEILDVDGDAYSSARSAAWATGTGFFSNYIVMTPSQMEYFNLTSALPLPEAGLSENPSTIALHSALTEFLANLGDTPTPPVAAPAPVEPPAPAPVEPEPEIAVEPAPAEPPAPAPVEPTPATPAPPTPNPSTQGDMTVSPSALNVRPAPSADNTPIGVVTHGTNVNVVDIVFGWARIAWNDGYAYVDSNFLN
ncbi:MAG: SH3 domain-containing protein [Defluviitaleaceae bacterium]|nr:SH3 domain-containing protein [Defluviitaleaceae bacterium]